MINISKYNIDTSILCIPNSVLYHFGAKTSLNRTSELILGFLSDSKQVIVVVVDGLGYDQLKNTEDCWLNSGTNIYRIPTVFPSSTPSALTSLHSGISPKEHGLLEWNMYIRELGQNIHTIPYTKQGSNKPITPIMPEVLFDQRTVYQKLSEVGVECHYYVDSAYESSVYSQATSKGSNVNGYNSKKSLIDSITSNAERLSHQKKKGYHFIHWALVDSAGHKYGPESQEYTNSVSDASDLLQEITHSLRKNQITDASLLITADHGQVGVSKSKYFKLKDEVYTLLATDRNVTILPSGGARCIFIKAKHNDKELLTNMLKKDLNELAIVLDVKSNEAKKLFGDYDAHDKLSDRIGDILVVPFDGVCVWHEFNGTDVYRENGDHGGLSKAEMYVPLILERP